MIDWKSREVKSGFLALVGILILIGVYFLWHPEDNSIKPVDKYRAQDVKEFAFNATVVTVLPDSLIVKSGQVETVNGLSNFVEKEKTLKLDTKVKIEPVYANPTDEVFKGIVVGDKLDVYSKDNPFSTDQVTPIRIIIHR